MPLISEKRVETLKRQAKAGLARARKGKEAMAERGMMAFTTAETQLTAGAMGYLRGMKGDERGDLNIVANVPADAAGGAVLVLTSLAGLWGKRLDDHALAVGNGMLASFVTLEGFKRGRRQGNRPPAQIGQAQPFSDVETEGALDSVLAGG